MIVTRKALSRRTMLKGLGAAISLPFLDAMTPAFAARQRGAAPPRLVLRAQRHRHAALDARGGRPARRAARAARAARAGQEGHPRPLQPDRELGTSAARRRGRSRTRGRRLHDRHDGHSTAGADLKLGVSADQIAATAIGKHTRLPSLEVGLEEARQAGNCDNGYSCAYTYNLSWKTESQPLPPDLRPAPLFERLFGADMVESPAAHARAASPCGRASSTA